MTLKRRFLSGVIAGACGAWPGMLPAGDPVASTGVADRAEAESDWIRLLPNLHTGAEGSPVQSVDLTGIVHLQYGHVDAAQGRADEFEFRRFRFGTDMRFLDHFAFRGKVNFDPEGDQFYKSLSQVFLSYSPYGNGKDDFARFRVEAGKIKARFSGEHGISPKRLKTFERSLLANQLAPSKTSSILVGGSEGSFDYVLSALAGEASTEFSRFGDGSLLLAKIGYSPRPALRLGLDYLTVFGDQEITSDISHALSLSASHNPRYSHGDLAFLVDLLFGAGDHEQPNVFGLVLLSSWQLGPKWELVARYQYAHSDGPDGLRLQRRYERAVEDLADGGWGETYHAAYLGANFRICGDQLKLMTGIEYSHMDGGDNGGDFDGWTWFAGLRTYF